MRKHFLVGATSWVVVSLLLGCGSAKAGDRGNNDRRPEPAKGTENPMSTEQASEQFQDLRFSIPKSDLIQTAELWRDGLNTKEIYIKATKPEESDVEIFITKLECPKTKTEKDLKQFATSYAELAKQNGVNVVNDLPGGLRRVLGTSGTMRGYYFDMVRSGHKSYERQIVLKEMKAEEGCISVKANSLGSNAPIDPGSSAVKTLETINTTMQYSDSESDSESDQ